MVPKSLPDSILLDTNIVILALQSEKHPDNPLVPDCRALWELALDQCKRVLISAVSMYELYIDETMPPMPTTRTIESRRRADRRYRAGRQDRRCGGAHPTVDNLRALAGLPPTSDTIGPAPYEIEETETRVSIHLRLYVLTRDGLVLAAGVRYEKPFARVHPDRRDEVIAILGADSDDGTTEFQTHSIRSETPETARALAAGLLDLRARAVAVIERFKPRPV